MLYLRGSQICLWLTRFKTKYSLCILVKQFQCSIVIPYQEKLLVLRSCHYLLIQNVDHSNPLRCCAVLTQLLWTNNKQADALENPEFPFQQTEERSLYRRFFKSMCFIESSFDVHHGAANGVINQFLRVYSMSPKVILYQSKLNYLDKGNYLQSD